MVPKLKDFLGLLETLAPMRLAEPWDNPGLQVGFPSQEITRIFSSLDPTLKALKSASEAKAQLLFTHHPLIFKPISRLDMGSFPGDVVLEAAKRGISVVAAHTNLDVARGGINDILANLLGLKGVAVLKVLDREEGVGLGRIGDLPEPAELSVVSRDVGRIFGAQHLKIVGKRETLIRRLAVVGGAGGGLTSIAHQGGADLLLTGDIGHHVALEAEALGIAILDAGHFLTEKTAFKIFAMNLNAVLESKGWEVSVKTDDEEIDPVWIEC